ncbi:hypothetical protein Tco_0998704 [Tanacetum coccineum]
MRASRAGQRQFSDSFLTEKALLIGLDVNIASVTQFVLLGYGVDLFCEAAGCRIMVCVSRFGRGLDTKESEYGSSYGLRELRNQFWNMVAYIWEKDLASRTGQRQFSDSFLTEKALLIGLDVNTASVTQFVLLG